MYIQNVYTVMLYVCECAYVNVCIQHCIHVYIYRCLTDTTIKFYIHSTTTLPVHAHVHTRTHTRTHIHIYRYTHTAHTSVAIKDYPRPRASRTKERSKPRESNPPFTSPTQWDVSIHQKKNVKLPTSNIVWGFVRQNLQKCVVFFANRVCK